MTDNRSSGTLYHGTSVRKAQSILRSGFKRAKTPHYCGHAVCLSESIGTAYEHGGFEEGGVVLEVELRPDARWAEFQIGGGMPLGASTYDQHFAATGHDAARTYHGNVWLLWRPEAVLSIRAMQVSEAHKLLAEMFEEDGPTMGYNGIVGELAAAFHDDQAFLAQIQPSARAQAIKVMAPFRHKQMELAI